MILAPAQREKHFLLQVKVHEERYFSALVEIIKEEKGEAPSRPRKRVKNQGGLVRRPNMG
jgi:hypothetical protein